MIRIGVVGCGHWGINHVRVFSQLKGAAVVGCADANTERVKSLKAAYSGIRWVSDYKDITRNNNIDAVVVATPASMHFAVVKDALENGKDVLCEKPLTNRSPEAHELVKLAAKKGRILMVGHVFMFNEGIRKLKADMDSKKYGRIYYLQAKRTNLGPFRKDVNALWDLASHDISIFNFILNSHPYEVSAIGGVYLQRNVEDVGFVSLSYPKNILVNIHISWLDPVKVRQITVVGSRKMVVWDDLDNIGPVKIYDRKVKKESYYDTFGEFQLLAKEGDILIPKVILREPLKTQNEHFLEALIARKQPLSGGVTGTEVVSVLEAAEKSLRLRGEPVKIKKG